MKLEVSFNEPKSPLPNWKWFLFAVLLMTILFMIWAQRARAEEWTCCKGDKCCGAEIVVKSMPMSDFMTKEEICIDCIIQIESSGNPRAYKNWHYGLMQISLAVFKEWEDNCSANLRTRRVWEYEIDKCNSPVSKLYEPRFNQEIGVWYLNRIKNYYLPHYGIVPCESRAMPDIDLRCTNTVDLQIIAYNWGIKNLVKWYNKGADWKKLPKETRNYLKHYHKLAEDKNGH